MRRAFALVELIIVACIIGILASFVVPMIGDRAIEAKGAAAHDHLRILRSAIKFYAARHAGIAPGYESNDPSGALSSDYFIEQTITHERYMRQMPTNPFNNLRTMQMLANGASFPADATGQFGWLYQPSTETIRLDWPGTDDSGIRYYDY